MIERAISKTRLGKIVVAALAVFAASVNLTNADPLHAFTTSTSGPGNVNAWNELSGTNLSGLAGADRICQALAAASGLANPTDYVAWLSDRDNDAYCRIFGLSGKKADRCGLASLPVGAGPWLRTDGVPFADTIENALDANKVYAPLNVDETGNRFLDEAESFTATDIDGTFNTQFAEDGDCNRWSSAAPNISGATQGSNLATGQYWTFDDGGVSCDQHSRLMCLQKGSGSPLMGHARFGHREAFVTSADVSGSIGGLAGADAKCQSLAASAHLYRPDSFKALLASSTLGVNATDRIEFDGAWYRRDGLLFAGSKAELVDGAVTVPLNVTEKGDYLGVAAALTGALADGAARPGFDCGGWAIGSGALQTSAGLVNMIASVQSSGTNWLNVADVSCAPALPADLMRKLLCLSDADVVFHDEFDAQPASP